MDPELTLTEYQLTQSALAAIQAEPDHEAAAHRLSYTGAIIAQYLTVTGADKPAYVAMGPAKTEVQPLPPAEDALSSLQLMQPFDISVNGAVESYGSMKGLCAPHALSHLIVYGKQTHAICKGNGEVQLLMRCIYVPAMPTSIF